MWSVQHVVGGRVGDQCDEDRYDERRQMSSFMSFRLPCDGRNGHSIPYTHSNLATDTLDNLSVLMMYTCIPGYTI